MSNTTKTKPQTAIATALQANKKEFEAWAKDNFLDVHRATDGGYFDALTSTTWFAWQTCAALKEQK